MLDVEKICADGVVDAQEVEEIRTIIEADGTIDRKKAEDLFVINDKVSGNDNDPGWRALFVKSITSHVLDDEESPNILDADEANWLISKIKGDGVVDDNEMALMISITENAKECTDDFINFVLGSARGRILEDGVIDSEEVGQIRSILYGSGGSGGADISREEANWLFELNDGVSGKENDPSWENLFVEALTSHVLADEESPNVLDEDETSWLVGKIEGDGTLDESERGLIKNILVKASKVTDSFNNFAAKNNISV